MKKVVLFLTICFLVACSSEPNNKINATKSEAGSWVMDSVSKKPVQEAVVYYQIAPTWGQSLSWSQKRADHSMKVSLAVVFLIVFIALLVGKISEAKWFPETLDNQVIIYNVLLFLTLVISVYFYFGDASGIKWNNDKWVKKEVYDKTIQETKSTQPIWDSLENNCLIVDGPYGCYSK